MESDPAPYAASQGKFQGATSPPGAGWSPWLGVAATVLLAGEAAVRAAWPLLAVGAIATAAFAVALARRGRSPGRAVLVGLGILAVALGVTGWRSARVALAPVAAVRDAVVQATEARDRLLLAAVASATRTGRNALQRVGASVPGRSQPLGDLLADDPVERAIVVLGGDTVIAVAGPHRAPPVRGDAPLVRLGTPFVRTLVVVTRSGGREAQVTLLLDAVPGVPLSGRTLAEGAGGWQRVGWAWDAGRVAKVHATTDAALAGVRDAMRPVAPTPAALVAREAALARLLVSGALVLLAVLVMLGGGPPAARGAAVLVPVWVVARTGVTHLPFGVTAVKVVVGATLLLVVAVVLWRRPARRAPIGVAAAILLLMFTPVLVREAARAVIEATGPDTLLAWFGWQAVIALAAAAFLAVASAPLRSRDDHAASATWGVLATIATVLVGTAGIVAWAPSGWAAWYGPLWLLPFACFLPVTSPRSRLVALAATAGVLAALGAWGAALERRVALAGDDLDRLGADPAAVAAASQEAGLALDAFARDALLARPTTIDRLYAFWQGSSLAAAGHPTHLALYGRGGGSRRESLALDRLEVSWADLDTLVASTGTAPRRVTLPRGTGRHEVLILPLAPDTIATITLGPRSRLVQPTRYGRLLGWRTATEPAYRLLPITRAARDDGEWFRGDRFVRADRRVSAGDAPRLVRAEIEIARPQPFAVRAALTVLLDLGLILGSWLILQELLTDGRRRAQPVFRRSYRRTVATALAAFFIVPALFFTLWSVLRLRTDAARQRGDDVTRTLRDVAVDGGLDVARAPRPDTDSLRLLADRQDAELGVYRASRLLAASTPLLVDLGVITPLLDPAARPAPGTDVRAVPVPLAGSDLRLGVEAVDTGSTLIAAVLPGAEADLARDQVDLLLSLLLASLGGIAAALLVAGVVARALGQPIETLRRTALAIGRREARPATRDVPLEFAPVFGAITQMEADLETTEAELEAGRARTAAILATVATGVVGVDSDGLVIHANPRAAELLGRALVVGAPLAAQLAPAWRPVADGVDRLLGPATRDAESRELEVDERRFATTLAPLGDGGLVLAITDITEASRAARIVAWGEMARQVAHEIKNPLTPMRLGLQHLRRVGADGHPDFPRLADETAERLLAEVERLDRIARSFARYGAPPEREGTPLEPIALRTTAGELASLFALSGEAPAVTVTGPGDGMVAARREELIQVLLNLLDNARQAGARIVRLEVEALLLRVVDDGHGIPPEQLARIFEPTFSTTTSGTGLGLAIVRRLVEGWGATIGVESEPGRGTTMTIRFAAPEGDATGL